MLINLEFYINNECNWWKLEVLLKFRLIFIIKNAAMSKYITWITLRKQFLCCAEALIKISESNRWWMPSFFTSRHRWKWTDTSSASMEIFVQRHSKCCTIRNEVEPSRSSDYIQERWPKINGCTTSRRAQPSRSESFWWRLPTIFEKLTSFRAEMLQWSRDWK